jgi:uncharacterized membrane protein YhaH (DUF805 family)
MLMSYIINLFNGRINRITYFVSLIPALILALFPLLLINSLYNLPNIAFLQSIELPVSILGLLYSSVFSIKRLHDIGQPGWIQLLVILLIPFLGFQGPGVILGVGLYSIYLLLMPGQNKPNTWGSKPSSFGKKNK